MAKEYEGPVTTGQELWVTMVEKSRCSASLTAHTPPLRFIAGNNHAAKAKSTNSYHWAYDICKHPSNAWDKKSKASNYYKAVYVSYEDAHQAYCEQIDKVVEQIENEKRRLTGIQNLYKTYKEGKKSAKSIKSNLTI